MDDLRVEGVNGQITIAGAWLTIERKGFFGRVGHSKGDRRNPTRVDYRRTSPTCWHVRQRIHQVPSYVVAALITPRRTKTP